MSVQINDGGPGDACHSLKQELSDDGKAVTFSTNSGTHADWSFLIEENDDGMSVWPLTEWHAVNISMTMNEFLVVYVGTLVKNNSVCEGAVCAPA